MKKSIKAIICLLAVLFLVSACAPRVDYDWQLEYINAPSAWATTKGDGITVAIVDSGIDYNWLGESFDKERVVTQYNSYACNDDVSDFTHHGTSMLYLIGASGENGFYGVAPECSFIIVKALNDLGMTNAGALARAIDFAVDNGADVINISLGSDNDSDLVTQAIDRAIDNNVVLVGAVGDQQMDHALFPARSDNVLSVGAIDNLGEYYAQGNNIDSADVLLPGVDIRLPSFNLLNELVVVNKSGSSIAAAVMSGVVALYLSTLQAYTAIKIYNYFKQFKTDLDLNKIINGGQ